MYKLPVGFDGNFLVGKRLEMVCFSAHQVFLHFGSEILITIESDFSLRPMSEPGVGRVKLPVVQSDLMKLLEHAVAQAMGDSSGTLTIEFDDGHLLACFDTSEQYESYSIKNGEQVIIV
jgi:hypothetical protein